jgi:Pep3/Vps18/deep orange family
MRDGSIVETYLEISDYIPNARYVRQVRNFASPILGLHVERRGGDARDVFIANRNGLNVFSGRITRRQGETASVYGSFFDEANSGQFQELSGSPTANPRIAVLPGSGGAEGGGRRHASFAWSTVPGLFHGNINSAHATGDDSIFSDATLVPYASLFSSVVEGKSILPELSQFHILVLHENQLVAVNRLNNRVVFKETVAAVNSPSLLSDELETR